MLVEASEHAIREPNTGAYRRASGEVDNKTCFNSRSIKAAVAKGWLEQRAAGGYIATQAGRDALHPGFAGLSAEEKEAKKRAAIETLNDAIASGRAVLDITDETFSTGIMKVRYLDEAN